MYSKLYPVLFGTLCIAIELKNYNKFNKSNRWIYLRK